jgi:hypothetical protein
MSLLTAVWWLECISRLTVRCRSPSVVVRETLRGRVRKRGDAKDVGDRVAGQACPQPCSYLFSLDQELCYVVWLDKTVGRSRCLCFRRGCTTAVLPLETAGCYLIGTSLDLISKFIRWDFIPHLYSPLFPMTAMPTADSRFDVFESVLSARRTPPVQS